MAVNESALTTWISLAATPEDKVLLDKLAQLNGNSSQSATVRRLIRQEAQRMNIKADEPQAPQA